MYVKKKNILINDINRSEKVLRAVRAVPTPLHVRAREAKGKTFAHCAVPVPVPIRAKGKGQRATPMPRCAVPVPIRAKGKGQHLCYTEGDTCTNVQR